MITTVAVSVLTRRHLFRLPIITGSALLVLLCGCTTLQPVRYTKLASSGQLRSNLEDHTGREPYIYSARPNWRMYRRIRIEPVEIYHGRDAQFGKLPQGARVELADYMYAAFARQLGTAFEITDRADVGVLRVRLTLTGAAASTPVLGTFSRFDPAGGSYNMVQSIRGREGMLTGSVIYAVEIFDGASQRLLEAKVVKQYPKPTNIGASLGALSAAKAGLRNGARDLLAQLSEHRNNAAADRD